MRLLLQICLVYYSCRVFRSLKWEGTRSFFLSSPSALLPWLIQLEAGSVSAVSTPVSLQWIFKREKNTQNFMASKRGLERITPKVKKTREQIENPKVGIFWGNVMPSEHPSHEFARLELDVCARQFLGVGAVISCHRWGCQVWFKLSWGRWRVELNSSVQLLAPLFLHRSSLA